MRVELFLPGSDVRALIRDALARYFKTEDAKHFDAALGAFCGHYGLAVPRIIWVEKFDRSDIAGYCAEDGTLELMRPSRWRRCRKYRTLRHWRQTVLHELGHLVLWADRETKADLFAAGMLR